MKRTSLFVLLLIGVSLLLHTDGTRVPQRMVITKDDIKDSASVLPSYYQPLPPARPLQYAYPKIPGSAIVGSGFDGTTMEKRGLPVIQLTWDDSYTWSNPIYPDMTYLVPLEFIIQNNVESLLVDGSMVFTNISDYETQTVKVDRHGGFLGFGSKSKTTIDYYRKYYEEDKNLAFTYQYHGWYKLTIPPFPPPLLNPKASKMVDLLPANYNPDKLSTEYSSYRRFIDTFGTHYVDAAVMGGMLKMTSWYHRCILWTFGSKWVKQQSGWSFLGIISSNSGSGTYQGNTSKLWDEFSQNAVTIHGGDSTLFQPNQWEDWIPTIKNNPTDIFSSLSPIYELISDATKQESMRRAVSDYFAEAKADENNLEQSLIPKDPHSTPDWCTNPPGF